MVLQRSFIKRHSFRIRVYIFKYHQSNSRCHLFCNCCFCRLLLQDRMFPSAKLTNNLINNPQRISFQPVHVRIWVSKFEFYHPKVILNNVHTGKSSEALIFAQTNLSCDATKMGRMRNEQVDGFLYIVYLFVHLHRRLSSPERLPSTGLCSFTP